MFVDVKDKGKEKMEKALKSLKKDLLTIRTKRANPSMLDKVTVDYYGSKLPIFKVANITTPDFKTLVITPWDKSSINEIERAIQKSDLGFTPINDGNVIRIVIPPLTEERRNDLCKLVRKLGEDTKVAIRNIRRELNDYLKKMEKSGELPEDLSKKNQDEIQKLTDKYIKEAENILLDKEKEILEV